MLINLSKISLCKKKHKRTFSPTLFQFTFAHFVLLFFVTITWIKVGATKSENHYANSWVVEIEGGNDVAMDVAANLGFLYHGKVLSNENLYWFSHPKIQKRSIYQSLDYHENLLKHSQVKWAEQEVIKKRVKRDLSFDTNFPPNDPNWPQMWYLLPTTEPSMNVEKAWKAGYSGRGISVTILDDGIEHSHPDLNDNYDPLASGDINSHDSDPTPRLNPSNENRHGTRCAGEVSAVANNGICSIGIAYNGKIGGVRMLDGQVTDSVEAASIGFNPGHVDIYSASWGPDDDGRTVDGPAKLARKAFVNGITEGRNGKGSIFVWASGNGGRRQDNCNCDGYTNSIYTLSISSTTQRGTKPWYSESCSSTLAATYSSGSQQDRQIVTTDLRYGCTTTHTGTSASAPLAAAICALALEANPNLTWRDMQHLVVQTSKPTGLDAGDWVVNGVGRKVSHAFGYGLMDAYDMVMKAGNWTLVPPQRKCIKSVIFSDQSPRTFSSNAPIIVPVEASSCDNEESMVERLEHVQAELTLRNERRGDLVIYLTSPSGTRSELLGQRRQDLTSQGFTRWAFMSTHTWDEDPRGRWSLEIHDRNQRSVSGTLSLFNLVMFGTTHSDWPEQARTATTTSATTSTTTTSTTTRTTTTTTTTAAIIPKKIISTTKHPVITTTTVKTTTLENNDSNCQLAASMENTCLVCKVPMSLNLNTGQCIQTCGEAHYRSYELVNKNGERKRNEKSIAAKFEISGELIIKGDGSFHEGYVCRPCSNYCDSCSGPQNADCTRCVNGATFRKKDSACVLVNSNTDSALTNHEPRDSQNIYYFSVIVFFVAIVLFAALFLFTRSPVCISQSDSRRYKPLRDFDHNPPPVYSDNGGLEYSDDPIPYEDLESADKSQKSRHSRNSNPTFAMR